MLSRWVAVSKSLLSDRNYIHIRKEKVQLWNEVEHFHSRLLNCVYCNNVTILERYNCKRVRIYVILTICTYICLCMSFLFEYTMKYIYFGINMPHYFYTGIQLPLATVLIMNKRQLFLYVTFSKLKRFYLLENVFSLMVGMFLFLLLNVHNF